MQIISSGRGVSFSAAHNSQTYTDPTQLVHDMAIEFCAKHGAEYTKAVEVVMTANPVLAREYCDITGT